MIETIAILASAAVLFLAALAQQLHRELRQVIKSGQERWQEGFSAAEQVVVGPHRQFAEKSAELLVKRHEEELERMRKAHEAEIRRLTYTVQTGAPLIPAAKVIGTNPEPEQIADTRIFEAAVQRGAAQILEFARESGVQMSEEEARAEALAALNGLGE